MGVLKKITNEYFFDSLREEDGKPGVLAGHRVIMPKNCDEMEFLSAFKLPYLYIRYNKDYPGFPRSMSGVDFSTKIEGGEKNLYMYSFDDFRKSETHSGITISEKMYNSFVDLLRDEMKDIEFNVRGNIIVGREDELKKIVEETGVNIGDLRNAVMFECDEKFNFLMRERFDNHVFYIEPSDSCYVFVDSTGYSGLRIEFTVFASTVRNWLSDEVERIKEMEAEEYIKSYKQKRLEKELEEKRQKRRRRKK